MVHRIAVILAVLAGTYFLAFGVLYAAGYRVYRIPSAAMQPTIQKGEMVVGRLSEGYRYRISRFDIVIHRTPQFPGEIYAKRVVGMPGESLVIDERGVWIDDNKLALPAAVSTDGLGLKKCSVVIPGDSIFVLGDFTSNSADSRYLGPVQKIDVLGYLVFKK